MSSQNKVKSLTGYTGEIVFDAFMPDGTLRKLLDIDWLRRVDWEPGIPLKEGLRLAHAEYLKDLEPIP